MKFTRMDITGSSHCENEDYTVSIYSAVVLSLSYYIRRVLECFNLAIIKLAYTLLLANMLLSWKVRPTSALEGYHMKFVPYAPVVRSLIYATITTQPDIPHVVGIVSKFLHNLGRAHYNVLKHNFRYLVGTKEYDIYFAPDEPLCLLGYTDWIMQAPLATGNQCIGIPSNSDTKPSHGR